MPQALPEAKQVQGLQTRLVSFIQTHLDSVFLHHRQLLFNRLPEEGLEERSQKVVLGAL